MTLFRFFIINASNLIRGIYLFSPGLVFLILYYFVIVKLPMGQDMLMQTVEYLGPFVFTNLSVILWMLLSWLSSRQIANLFIIMFGAATPRIYTHFPRLLGYNVAVGLQLAALNLPAIVFEEKTIWLFWALLLFHNVYYFLLDTTFNLKTRRLITISIVTGISYIILFIYLFGSKSFDILFIKDALRYPLHIEYWMFLSIFYFLLQILFVFVAVQKRKTTVGVTVSTGWKRIFYGALFLSLLLYLIILFSPDFAIRYGSLGCLLLAMGLWVAFVCKIKSYAVKYNFRFTMLIVLWAILLGSFYDPYDVNLEETTTRYLYAKRPDIDQYLDAWIQNPIRSNVLNKDTTSYPIYLVIADGGASKSGYWVASVLSKLEKAYPEDKFSDHLLSLAGASGGSVGNLAFYTTLVDPSITIKDTTKVISDYPAAGFFEADFLTYPLARFLGPDLLRHLVPFLLQDDRAEALATAMEKSDYNSEIGQYFKGTLDTVFDYSGRLPIVFINTTNIESGSSGVISNVKINTYFTHRLDVLSQLDADVTSYGEYKNIKLSTAVVLGARFPYLSPAGEINNKYFVDGGYYDNSGGGITSELLQRIETRMKSGKTDDVFYKLRNRLKFKIIYISNGVVKKEEPKTLPPLVNDLAAPLITVLGTYGNQTELSNKKLQDYIECSSFRMDHESFRKENLPKDSTDNIIPYPMNWVISDYNIRRMEKNLIKVDPKEVLGRK